MIPRRTRWCHVATVTTFCVMVGLIAAMVGCAGRNNPPPSKNLEIRTWYDLNATRNNLAGNHTLMNNLDSTTLGYEELASPTANGGNGWEPIGTFITNVGSVGFWGTFDGQGYEIRDVYINRPDEDFVGLFGFVEESGVVKDIGVMNVTATGNNCVGGLAGDVHGTLHNSYSNGNVTGNERVGGLVGTGGGTIINSYSTGNVTGYEYVGGLAGWYAHTVSHSYSTGSVSGDSSVGGLVGYKYYGTVSDSYSTASVSGGDMVGGLAGLNWGGNVSNSYSTGSVTGNSSVGGLVGWNEEGTVSDSFWDTQTSGQPTSADGTGKNTTEMQDIATFSGAGWNIAAVALNETNPAYIWNIITNVTYPFLSWQS